MGRKFFIHTAALLALGVPVFSEQLLEQGSFELPPVTRSKPRSAGGDVSKVVGDWVLFKDKEDAAGGRLVAGLTNKISRTGRQSLFVEFDKLTKPQARAVLASTLVPVLPGKPYHVGIWGRVDRENPLALDQRLPYLKLRVDWFAEAGKEIPDEDAEAGVVKAPEEPAINVTPLSGEVEEEEDVSPATYQQVGEVVMTMQPMPGSKNLPPLFKSGEWSEFFVNIVSPVHAAFIKVTWSWETPPQSGETTGVIYFDDATVEGESGPREKDDDGTEDEADAPPAAPVAPASPAPAKPDATRPPAPKKGGGVEPGPLSADPKQPKR